MKGLCRRSIRSNGNWMIPGPARRAGRTDNKQSNPPNGAPKILAEKGSLSDQLAELTEREEEREQVDDRIHSLEHQIRNLLKDRDRNEKKIKELRDERHALQVQRRSLEKQTRDLEEYLHVMRTMTSYTRTRRDYEHLILRLSAQQEEALRRIDLSSDFLITGGRERETLVLLKAIGKKSERATSPFSPIRTPLPNTINI